MYLSENLQKLSLPTSLNGADWPQVILHLVSSWTLNGIKLNDLNWPPKQVSEEDAIKKVPSWSEKGTKLLHKKVSYLIRILLLSLSPISLDQLMTWMDYANRHSFRENYLLPLQQVGFIKMTKPDTPNTPKQKYVLTEKGKQFLTRKQVKKLLKI